MIAVSADKASAKDSGKAMAYLDPLIMAREGLCSGEIVRIRFRRTDGFREFLLRLGPECDDLKDKNAVRIDSLYWQEEMEEGTTTVFVERVSDCPHLSFINLDASPHLTREDPYRKMLESLLMAFRLPVRAGCEIDFILGEDLQFHAKVKKSTPLTGGLIGPTTEITLGKEELKSIRNAKREMALKRRVESLEAREKKFLRERETLRARVEELKKENIGFDLEAHRERKKKMENHISELSTHKDRLKENRNGLLGTVTDLVKKLEDIKNQYDAVWTQLMKEAQYSERWGRILKGLERYGGPNKDEK